MNKYFSILLAIVFLVTSCKDDELSKIHWVCDPHDSQLPEYSEWGYNSFGAYFNNDYFTSFATIDGDVCRLNSYDDNTMSFRLFGDENTDLKTLRFVFPYPHIFKFNELGDLNQRKFNLANANDSCSVYATINNGEYLIDVQQGTLSFNRVQIVRFDGKQVEAILSGEFEVFGKDNYGNKFRITDGRFDLGINEKNLY